MNVLAEIEIAGSRVIISDESPPEWQEIARRVQSRQRGEEARPASSGPLTGRNIPQRSSASTRNVEPGAYEWKRFPDLHTWRSDAAIFFAKLAAKALGAKEPRFVWFFRECRNGEELDFTSNLKLNGGSNALGDPDAILIHRDLRGSEFIEVVAHETYHSAKPSAAEESADRFGKEFAARFGHIPERSEIHVNDTRFNKSLLYDPPELAGAYGVGFETNSKSGLDLYLRDHPRHPWQWFRTVRL